MPDVLPAGIKPVTGLLTATANLGTITAGASAADRLRFDLGSGFVTGVWGASINTGGWSGGDGQQLLMTLTTDLDLTAVVGGARAELWTWGQITQLTTSGQPVFPQEAHITWPAPILVAQDLNVVGNATIVNISAAMIVYYQIMEVTDAQFLRIAGITLARGA